MATKIVPFIIFRQLIFSHSICPIDHHTPIHFRLNNLLFILILYLLDRLKRTPLIHACLNGHAHVASYLLSVGANPGAADSSGNTCLHYAAAYGW